MNRYVWDTRFCILLSVLFLLIPLPWVIAWLVTVYLHEISHWMVVKFYGGSIDSFYLGLTGANMRCSGLTNREYLLAILAGPISGFALGLLGRWFPRLSICGWILSMYNLLPILSLDGGQALRILVKNNTVCSFLEKIVMILLSILAVIASVFMSFGPLSLIVVISLWVKKRKRPCKEMLCAVQ